MAGTLSPIADDPRPISHRPPNGRALRLRLPKPIMRVRLSSQAPPRRLSSPVRGDLGPALTVAESRWAALGALPQLPYRSAEVGLDAARLLEAVIEKQLGDRLALRTADGGEI